MILSLQSTTFGAHGGIPTYNRVVCRALSGFDDSIEKQVFLVTDTPADLDRYRSEFPNVILTAFSGRRGAFVQAVVRLILNRKIKLLLIGHVNYAPIGLLLRLLRPSLRYGVMVHGVDVWLRLPFLKRKAIQKADFVSSVSEYTKEQVVTLNQVDPERVYVLPNALEWKESQVPATFASAASATRLLSVCRLSVDERYKGVDTVIEALPAVIKAFPDLEYFVIGSGTDLDRHKQLAADYGVSDRVHFLGSVDLETLQFHFNQCDIFVMPSAGEGFGIVFLEAMRYAKPVIAADSGGVPEVVEDGTTGILIKYGDSEGLAAAIVSLSLNPDRRHSMGEAGQARLQKKFTYQCFKERFTEILNRELSTGNCAPSSESNIAAQSL